MKVRIPASDGRNLQGTIFIFEVQDRMSDKQNSKLNVSFKPTVSTKYISHEHSQNFKFFRDEKPGIDPADPELKDLSKDPVSYPYNMFPEKM
jgi:hypothetical protein